MSLAGTTLAGRYDILSLLGTGGMGEVYRARDRELEDLVALKVIRADLVAVPGLVERFRREVKLARRVTHNNVARTFELGRDGDVVFCTMELIDGESLTRRLVRHKRLAVPEATAIARAVWRGARGRARGRRDPPRHQARQHTDRGRRARGRRRLRRRGRADRERRADRHRGVHGAGAGDGRAAHADRRRLRGRRRAVRDADRPARVPRRPPGDPRRSSRASITSLSCRTTACRPSSPT